MIYDLSESFLIQASRSGPDAPRENAPLRNARRQETTSDMTELKSRFPADILSTFEKHPHRTPIASCTDTKAKLERVSTVDLTFSTPRHSPDPDLPEFLPLSRC